MAVVVGFEKSWIIIEKGFFFDFIFYIGKHTPALYEFLPDLEISAKAFVEEQVSKKECTFISKALSEFITKEFCEITGINKENIIILFVLREW